MERYVINLVVKSAACFAFAYIGWITFNITAFHNPTANKVGGALALGFVFTLIAAIVWGVIGYMAKRSRGFAAILGAALAAILGYIILTQIAKHAPQYLTLSGTTLQIAGVGLVAILVHWPNRRK